MGINSKRFLTLDIFRGLTVCFMIIVNSIPSEEIAYAPLLHATWFGFTPTDLVFPSFLFAIGNSLCFGKRKWNSATPKEVYGKILKRSILIFLIGYLMYWFPFFHKIGESWSVIPIHQTRIMGVLQRIGIASLIASLLIYKSSKKTHLYTSVGLLLLYQVVLLVMGIPGKDPFSIEGNAVLRTDLFFLGPKHLYTGEGIPFDPEGLLSSLPSVVNIILGYLAGAYLLDNRTSMNKLLKLSLIGFSLIAVGYLWSYSFPISKKLWTSSYVLLSTGIDIALILVIYVFVEQSGKEKLTSWLLVFGKNPLAIYIFSQLFLTILHLIHMPNGKPFYIYVFEHYFMMLGGKFGCLIQSLLFTYSCWLLGFVLDKKKIYIKL